MRSVLELSGVMTSGEWGLKMGQVAVGCVAGFPPVRSSKGANVSGGGLRLMTVFVASCSWGGEWFREGGHGCPPGKRRV